MELMEPSKKIQVTAEADICVIGGGVTGIFAAIRAARLGAKVVIVEKQNCFGGTATNGFVNIWHSLYDTTYQKQIIAGLTQEVLDRLSEYSAAQFYPENINAYRIHTEYLKIVLDQMAIEEDVQVLFHTWYAGCITEGHEIRAIIVENKNGRQAILTRFVIDASGDGDVARDLRIPSYTREGFQPPTPCCKVEGNYSKLDPANLLEQYGKEFGLDEDWGWDSSIPGLEHTVMRADFHIFHANCADAVEKSHAEIIGRQKIEKMMKLISQYGKGKYSISALCSEIGIRETRHYRSCYPLQEQELLEGRQYEDAVCNGTYRVDIHHPAGKGIIFRYLDGTEERQIDRTSPPQLGRWKAENEPCATFYQVPFRSLIQEKYHNFIAVGRMIDADEGAFGAIRVMVNLNQLGEAAGTAAYESISTDTAIQQVEPQAVRSKLKQGGSIIL